MPEPKIEPHLHKDRQIAIRPFLVGGVPLFVLLLALLLTCFKKCTALGEAGRATLYDPTATLAADEGFVGKANQLLNDLLLQVSPETQGTCLDSLNKRYKALEFALPYGEEHKAYIEASDLRLVAIHPEYIEDAKMREFYYNSRLPQLLQRQNDQLSETYFRFTCHADQKRVDGIRPLQKSLERFHPGHQQLSVFRQRHHLYDLRQHCTAPTRRTTAEPRQRHRLPSHHGGRHSLVRQSEDRLLRLLQEGVRHA